ncbi:hypothetical protein NHG29_00135 [Aerococcaceae bacterium NML160702]|nr:hypothetical protein [Aerococcaceae bacterium NML160702]
MDFSTFFNILKSHLSDGSTIPEFFMELIEMITEEDSDSVLDLIGITADKASKNYTSTAKVNRNFTKKMASKLLYRLSLENMGLSIESRGDDCIKSLAVEMSVYFPDINMYNVTTRVPEIFADIIKEKAGVPLTDTVQKKVLISQSTTLKNEHGRFLLIESNNRCAFPSCDSLLIKTKNGLDYENYEISKIDKSKGTDISNLIPLCPDCFLTYQSENRKIITNQLANIKRILASNHVTQQTLSAIKIDEGITEVLIRMSTLKYDNYDISFDIKGLTDKIAPARNRALYNTVKNQVIDNYVTLDKILVYLDKQGKIDYIEIQSQMRSMYKKLKQSKRDSLEIFNTISDKIHHATLQDMYFCQMIVSFFIQKCEVLE